MTGAGQAYTRLGLGNDDSGLYWNYDAYTNAVSVVKEKNGVKTEVEQSLFNGNNLSAVTVPATTGQGATVTSAVEWTKYQLFYIDYEWLGAGAVRFGVMINDSLIVAHTFTNFNALTAPYIPIPNHPARYEAYITAPAIGTIQLIEGCCSVSINTPPTWPPSTNTSLSYVSATVRTNWPAAETPVLAIRGQQGTACARP